MISTIIFDWGGVFTVGRYTQSILDIISKEKSVQTDDLYAGFDALIHQMDDGKILFSDFVMEVNKKFKFNFSEGEIGRIFKDAIILNSGLVHIIRKLHQNYNLILMSNNNEMTVRILKENSESLLGLFSKLYFSCELKMRKPDLRFFNHVLEDSGLKAEESIFIDDKQKNIDAAERCGIHGIIFVNNEQLKKELKKIKIIF